VKTNGPRQERQQSAPRREAGKRDAKRHGA
jgi:hypothetical protein